MITKDYDQNKEEVLALYNSLKNDCEQEGIQISENIENQAQKIRDEIFNLMVLGESKSGKSTFINAYLGKEVVPMDVRQCTSAIIKITRGDTFKLVAKQADGKDMIITEEEKIREFLKKNASIDDEYRNIPVTTINNEILIKYANRPIPNEVIDSFLEKVAKDNISGMDSQKYNKLIRKYIKNKRKTWTKIITEIDICYPLPEAMQGITLIDSPGVGAAGNVGVIAEEFIENANAIVFVKYLKGQAIESVSFMNFLRNTCSKKHKESLFLVLNGKSDLQGSEYASLMNQAVDVYQKDIHSERIIGIDSKVQLFLNKCRELGTEEAIDEFFDKLDDEGEDFLPASNCWNKSVRKGGLSYFEEKMGELSNFSCVHTAIEKFARVANYIQLIDFLQCLETEYNRINSKYESVLKIARDSMDDPDILEKKIKNKKEEINDIYTKLNDGVEEIRRKYTDNINGEGIIVNEANKKGMEYKRELQNFTKLPDDKINEGTFSEMQKITLDAIEDTKKYRREIAIRVIDECNEKLIQYIDDPEKIPAEAYKPNFTETDFSEINKEARNKTTGVNKIEEGWTFKKVKRIPYHYWDKHVELVANSICERLDNDIIPAMINNAIEYVNICTGKYQDKLNVHVQDMKNEYNSLLSNKDKNDSIIDKVNNYDKKLKMVKRCLGLVSKMKGDLESYVKR